MNRLELVAASADVDRACAVAKSLAGTLYSDEREDASQLPFRALVSVVTDDPEPLLAAADVGAYLVCRRVMKARSVAGSRSSAGTLPGAIALFTMVHHPDLSHGEADRHWRDRHTPLALQHHVAMSHYTQLSVVHRLQGPEWDGFALCGFDSIEDLKERFFATPEGRIAIRNDVARFADGKQSPRRLIATETFFG